LGDLALDHFLFSPSDLQAMQQQRAALVVAMLCAVVALATAYPFQFEVPAGGEQCFYETVEQNKPVVAVFQVIAGGFNDINIVVRVS